MITTCVLLVNPSLSKAQTRSNGLRARASSGACIFPDLLLHLGSGFNLQSEAANGSYVSSVGLSVFVAGVISNWNQIEKHKSEAAAFVLKLQSLSSRLLGFASGIPTPGF